MKNSIVYLGVVLITFTSMNSVEAANNHQTSTDSSKTKSVTDAPKVFYASQDTAILYPDTILGAAQFRSIEEVIASDNLIIGNVDSNSLPEFIGKTIEEIITEDNRIIEAEPVVIAPLDFDAIDAKDLKINAAANAKM